MVWLVRKAWLVFVLAENILNCPRLFASMLGLDPHSLPNTSLNGDAGEKSSGYLSSSVYAPTLQIAVAFLKPQLGLSSGLLTGLPLTAAASWHLYSCETSLQSNGCASRKTFYGASRGSWCVKLGQGWAHSPEEL